MNEVLREAFRHSAWATRVLIDACRRLPPEQLRARARGYGSIVETLDHVVRSDAGYAAILSDFRPAWAREASSDLDRLAARAEETARAWERLLADPVDGERRLVLEAGAYECPAAVVLAQALHHAAAHREQVRAGLAELGGKPPDLQPWAYADETGRARWRTAE